ncbi:hypothetical protein L7F22_004302 [Adiantum nelumboides]|nr:hypothetical protein [Adiantum nelumboides]
MKPLTMGCICSILESPLEPGDGLKTGDGMAKNCSNVSGLMGQQVEDDIKEYLTSKDVEWEETSDLMDVASKCDVVYQTRIQRERFGDRTDLYAEARGKFIVDKHIMNHLQSHAVVLHPLPRLDEITVDVDSDPRAAYFRQAKNGLYIRMALLKLLLVGW